MLFNKLFKQRRLVNTTRQYAVDIMPQNPETGAFIKIVGDNLVVQPEIPEIYQIKWEDKDGKIHITDGRIFEEFDRIMSNKSNKLIFD